jgi:hypothetical protein
VGEPRRRRESNLFEDGFLGLDNIGPFDRSNMPVDGLLEQSDRTAWIAGYCMVMLTMALELAREDRSYDGLVTKFGEHFSRIAHVINSDGLWDEEHCSFFDRLRGSDGTTYLLRYRSLVGLIPLLAAITVEPRFGLSAETLHQRSAAHDERRRGEKSGLAELIQMRRDDDGDRLPRLARRPRPAPPRPRRRALRGLVPLAVRAALALTTFTSTSRSRSRSTASAPRSDTSPPSRARRCSAATRTGAARSGCR